MTKPREHWEDVYRTKADTDVSWYETRPKVSTDLIAATGLGLNSRIVDVGGGASHLVDALIAVGFAHVTVLDLSAAALTIARARLPADAAVDWIAGDVRDWVPDTLYDIWHDRAAFHFLTTPDEREAYRSVLCKALRPGGYAIIGTFAPDGPERCSGLPVSRHDATSLMAVFGQYFRLVKSLRHDHKTPGGAVQRFHFGLLQRS
ncbi:MAG: class I SAM-dependent methyltransferase [Flavimaricola sp.]|nr:class I SAM-dependent methyltransferase [Flavimaricola sp.]